MRRVIFHKAAPLVAIIYAVVLLSISVSSTSAEDRRPDRQTLSVMTMNTYFMWDGVAPEEGSRNIDIPWRGSATEASEHMEALAQVIARNNPDIIHLVEVENGDALARLVNDHLSGRGYRHFFDQGSDSYTGQDVALLSRIDPDDDAVHYDDRRGRSGNLQKKVTKNYFTTLTIGEMKVLVVGLHLLARPNDSRRLTPRQAQADAIRKIVQARKCSACEVIVLGDFNDYDGSTGARDHADSAPITSVLLQIKRLDVSSEGDDLINVARYLPKANRYTAFWDQDDDNVVDHPRELTSIDHILVSKGLADRIESVSVDHAINPVLGTDGFVSDHFPIIVRFDLSPTTPRTSRIRLVKILPNPEGDESQNEEATILNDGDNQVDLRGWRLVDRKGAFWQLDGEGTLAPRQEVTVRRQGQPMAMTNTGDTIELRDGQNNLVGSITYRAAVEGEHIFSN